MMIEKLEQRKLLSATLTQTGGVLKVQLENTGGDVEIFESANNGAGNTVKVIDVNNASFGTDFTGVNRISVLGGDGADTIVVQLQNVPVFVNGGAGDDQIAVFTDPEDQTLNGPVFNPSYTGAGSIIFGGDGNDFIDVAGLSNSVVMGGGGADTVIASAITLQTVTETDISGGSHMLIAGDAGDDVITVGDGQFPGLSDSVILGGTGNDTITDLTNTITDGNIINGGPGADAITVSVSSNTMVVGNTNGDVVQAVL